MKKKVNFFFLFHYSSFIISSIYAILFRDFEHHITYLENNSISTNSSKMFGTFHPKNLIQ